MMTSSSFRFLGAALLASLLTAAVVVREVSSQPPPARYGVVGLKNETNVTINFSYRIGAGPWEQASIKPGGMRWWSNPYKEPNPQQPMSPLVQIHWKPDPGNSRELEAALKRHVAPSPEVEHGHLYTFRSQDGQIKLLQIR